MCHQHGEAFDKSKDPFSNSESFLKGEKTSWEETVLASDWLIISTESQLIKLAWMTPSCSYFIRLYEREKGKVTMSASYVLVPCNSHIISHYSPVK